MGARVVALGRPAVMRALSAFAVALALWASASASVHAAPAAPGPKRTVSTARLRAAAITSTPIPASPIAGTLNASTDPSDAFSVALAPGDRLSVEVTGAAGTDIDLFLLWPTAQSLDEFDLAAASVGVTYPEQLEFDCAQAGTYYLHVYCGLGSGAYTATWTIAPATSTPTIGRAAGATRYETAIAASAQSYPAGTSRDAVLATGEKFPDALAASGLAGILGCPVLLTPVASLPAGVVPELERLGVTDVHIVGGSAAVSEAIRDQLDALGYATYRYAGADRYDTSAVVANAVLGLRATAPPLAFVARGDLYPDALSVSPIAYQHAYPVLLTRSSGLPTTVRASLNAASPATIIVAGGTGAVPAAVATQIEGLAFGPDVVRLGGPTRYETATLIDGYAVSHYLAMPDRIGFVCGTRFPDAVVGGPAIGHWGGMLLLTETASLNASSRTSLEGWADSGLVDEVTIYGGTVAVSDAAQGQIAAVLP
ncbi:MAG: hypothetical protein FDZ70_08065 [Actinobacteria bacterium]|nr:MAG: hypothetical protein FDZ70_08065 [Actinomycetota bacterium]